MNKKEKTQRGITLIALVITIIVMLILVAVTISMAVNGGLFDYAGKAVGDTNNVINAEQELSEGAIQVDGVWYDSIDDYLAKEPSGPVKIKLGRVGIKVTNVPLPSSDFEHVEGTIETGYVIRHKTDGNEFVWVPVEKEQKLTIEVESEKDIKKLEIYDPYGDKILEVADGDIEGTYSNTAVEPTVNGMYIAVATTENEETGEPEITQKTLTVKSLYALDTMNDWYTSEEFAVSQGAANKDAYVLAAISQLGFSKVEDALAYLGYPTVDVAMSALLSTDQYFNWKQYQDTEDYKAVVEKNGGFYIARYEAGAPIARTSGDSSHTVEAIKTANGVPVSKEGYAPYNYVTPAQALGLAESMYESNNSYTVSLITGAGWDRTLGWIKETGSKSMKEIVEDSTTWGNYYDVTFDITKGKYSENNGSSYTEVSETYTKPTNTSILLTTGATTRNSANNIFDLAGNIYEWTCEGTLRGGFFFNPGIWYNSLLPVSVRNAPGDWFSDFGFERLGFRTALYIK